VSRTISLGGVSSYCTPTTAITRSPTTTRTPS
jgi:hypothetical protein